MIDPTTLNDFTLSDLCFPDHADVYVDWAEDHNGIELTDEQLDYINEQCFDWVFEQAFELDCY